MNSQIFDMIGIDPGYIILGLLGFNLILLILVIILMVKFKNTKKTYTSFMRGKSAESLEDTLLSTFKELDGLKEKNAVCEKNIEDIKENLKITFQKTAILKYDAFKEMGGKMSFAVALLNQKNDGYLFNVMHNREGCYAYMKEIIGGESFIVLSDEEKEALKQAVNQDNYME